MMGEVVIREMMREEIIGGMIGRSSGV